MSTIKRIRKAVHARAVEFSDHAIEEMDHDGLTLDQVLVVLLHGTLYAEHGDDPRGVRYVVRGAAEDEDIDVVCRLLESGLLWIITVYVVGDPEDNE
jgi:hypothetical protein